MRDPSFVRLLVPTSGPVPAQKNAAYIVDMARRLRASLLVIHIQGNDAPRDGKVALSIFEEEAAKRDVPIETRLDQGPLIRRIREIAEEDGADMIVVGKSEGMDVADWVIADLFQRSDIPIVVIPFSR